MTFPYQQWFPDAAFDGRYGYDLAALRAIRPTAPPAGFDAAWTRLRREADLADVSPVLRELDAIDGRRVFELEHGTTDDLRLRAWLALPARGTARVGIVQSHGYGGRDAPDFSRVPDDAAVVFPVARGLGALNVGVGAPDRPAHVLHGIDSIERYVLVRCAADLWSVADALTEVVGSLPLYYVGESFGGGIGALALPWDDRYVGATLIVPSFGQNALRLELPCEGSGEIVRGHVERHPEARDVLRFADAAAAATRLRIPVRVEAALWDTVVPPPGQFAVANAVEFAARAGTGAELELEVLPAGHAEYPGRDAVTASAVAAGREHLERAVAGASARA